MEIAGSFSLGKVAPVHDVDIEYRSTLKNVDPSLIKNNIVYIDELQGRTIEQYTNDEMQPFIDEYDANQKRKDRKIMSKYENYIDWHMSDKKMMKGIPEGEKPEWAYEFVLQYGNHEDYWHEYFDPNTSESRKQEMHDQADNEFKELIKEFKERYPHAHIVLAAAHFDEPAGSGHLHLIVQFRANEYERSLKTRVSTSRALTQDGFEYIQSTSEAKEIEGFQMERLFKDFRHNVMNEHIKAMGFDIKEEEHGTKHYDCSAYKKIMKKATQTLEDAERVREEAAKEATQTIEAAEIQSSEIIKDAQTKADGITYFTDKVKEVERDNQKVLKDGERSKYPELIKTTYKDTPFSKPRDVAIQDLTVYESQEATKNIAHAVEDVKRTEEQVMKAIKDTIQSISSDRVIEDKREIERLNKVIEEKDKIIEKQQEKIGKLEQIVDTLKEFIQSLDLVQKLNRFWERKKQERAWARSQIEDPEFEPEYNYCKGELI